MTGKTVSRWNVTQPRLAGLGDDLPELAVESSGALVSALRASEPLGGMDWVWRSAAMPVPVLVADEAARLPRASFDKLVALGVLRSGGLAAAVGCDACDLDHAEWVETVTDAAGRQRHYINCIEKGRVEVAAARLERWLVDFAPVAGALARGLVVRGGPEAVQPGRLWRLGRAVLAGRSRELWMVREDFLADSPEALDPIAVLRDPVVFTLGGRAPAGAAGLARERTVRVEDVLRLTADGFAIDRARITARLGRLRPARMTGRQPAAAGMPLLVH